jgi:hypothetical protein
MIFNLKKGNSAMKLRHVAVALGLLIGTFAPAPAEAAGKDFPRELLCNGPIVNIADDDPGLALFADSPESLTARKVALRIERINGCDDSERNPFDRIRHLLDELALPGPADGRLRALLHEIETDGQFVCDDNPARMGCDAVAGEPWSCEAYIAEDQPPWPGCTQETKPGDRP